MEEDIISKFWTKEAYVKTKKKILQSDTERLYEDKMKNLAKTEKCSKHENWKFLIQ